MYIQTLIVHVPILYSKVQDNLHLSAVSTYAQYPKCGGVFTSSASNCAEEQTRRRHAYPICHLSLLLAAAGGLLFPLARNDLPQHHDTVAVHEGDTRQAFAILERVAHQGLLWLDLALRHLVGLQRVRILHLLPTGLLPHL